MLRAKGLIRGASTANAVVLTDVGLLEGALRWPDEFVRHKAMDCVGDLALAGRRLRARVSAIRPSHRGTVTLVRGDGQGRRAGSRGRRPPRRLARRTVLDAILPMDR